MVLVDGEIFFKCPYLTKENGNHHMFVPRFCFEILVVYETQKFEAKLWKALNVIIGN